MNVFQRVVMCNFITIIPTHPTATIENKRTEMAKSMKTTTEILVKCTYFQGHPGVSNCLHVRRFHCKNTKNKNLHACYHCILKLEITVHNLR